MVKTRIVESHNLCYIAVDLGMASTSIMRTGNR